MLSMPDWAKNIGSLFMIESNVIAFDDKNRIINIYPGAVFLMTEASPQEVTAFFAGGNICYICYDELKNVKKIEDVPRNI